MARLGNNYFSVEKKHHLLIHRTNCLLLLFFALACSHASGQYYNLGFRNYSSFNGLSQSEVQCVYEDKTGFLWIGTGYGLTLFDGRDFTSYYHRINDSTSLGGNLISDITEDKKGRLWFSIYNSGISRMDPLTKKFRNFHPSVKKNSILSDKVNRLLVDEADRIWVGSDQGLSVYDQGKDAFQNIIFLDRNRNKLPIRSMEKDRMGNIWLGSDEKIYYSRGDASNVREVKKNIELKGINSFQFDGRNNGWLATEEGLFSFTMAGRDSISLERPSFFRNKVDVKDIEFDGHGNLWIGKRTSGLAIYFPATGFFDELKEDYTSSRGLLSNRLSDLYFDNSGGMWVSGENGLQSFHDEAQRFNIYPGLSYLSEYIRGSTMYGLAVDTNLIILATSGGVIAYDRILSKNLPIIHQHELKGTAIRYRDVKRENANTWWVTTDSGLFELIKAGDSFILRRPAALTDPDITRVSLRNYLKDGNIYWFGTYGDGLIRYDIHSKQKKWFRPDGNNERSLGYEVVNKILYDKDKNILVCHDNGLSILYKGAESFERYYADGKGNRLSNRYVYDAYDDGERIWIGTFGGGINVLDKKTKEISYLTTSDGLCDDAIYTITAENDSVLWLGTNKGLARLSTRSRSFRNFEKNDGMPSEEFNMLSAHRSENGEIFMGTVAGLVSFFPMVLTKNQLLPGVYLTKVRKNGAYIGDSAIAVINRDHKIVTKFGEDLFLEFSPMTFYGVSKPELTYRIREQGEEWMKGETGGLLPLVKFEPGIYTLDIRMKSYSGSESSPVWTLTFTVLPPFWKTIGFRILVFLFLLMLSYQVVRQIIKRRLERQRAEFLKQQAVEQERSRISAELHDDIGGGLTAIRLLSEMSLEHDSHHPTSKYLERISASSNELIQKMNEIVWALNINNDNLQSLIAYTRQYAVSYLDDLNISCDFETPESIPDVTVNGKSRRSVFLLVKESLNNIAKHAHATRVNISIEVNQALHIHISDNGKGISGENVTSGNGLINMRKRTQSMKGNMVIRNGAGTTVIFNIPLKNLNV